MSVQPLRPLADALRAASKFTVFSVTETFTDADVIAELLDSMQAHDVEHIDRREARRLAAIFAADPLSLFTSEQEIGLLAWIAARMAASHVEDRGIDLGADEVEERSVRAELVHDVALVLGLRAFFGEHGAAWPLCELAGWPS